MCEIRQAGLYRELWQSFCVLPDIRTVGVQGDERTYGYVVVVRAVTSDGSGPISVHGSGAVMCHYPPQSTEYQTP